MPDRRTVLKFLACFPVAHALVPGEASARETEIYQNPIAINAIDPVGYFVDQKPVKGAAQHQVNWNGAEWHFTNADNARKFRTDPTTYAPMFGGYCAFAASRGYLAPTIPEAWTIYEGKLYLNASLRARELWLRDVPGNIKAGLNNWPGILG